MRVLVCGLGSIGSRHARNIFEQFPEFEIYGMDPDLARRVGFSFGDTFDSLSEALTAHSYDLGIVCSPNRYHVEQAMELAAAGISTFVEKPLGTTMEGLDQLEVLIARHSLFFHVGSNWKFHKAFVRMKTLIDEGFLGNIVNCQILSGQWLPDWHPWEDYRFGYSARKDLGGGIVFDTHEIDYFIWLLGDIKNFFGFARNSNSLEIDTDDVLGAVFELESGCIVTLLADYIQRRPVRKYHLAGSEGTIEWSIETNQLRCYRSDGTEFVEDVSEDLNEMYVRQLKHIVSGVNSNTPPVTPLQHAMKVLEIQLGLVIE